MSAEKPQDGDGWIPHKKAAARRPPKRAVGACARSTTKKRRNARKKPRGRSSSQPLGSPPSPQPLGSPPSPQPLWSPPSPQPLGSPLSPQPPGSPLSSQPLGSPLSPQPLGNIVGRRISHEWKEGDEPTTHWKGTVLDQVSINPSVYFVKYDGIDCVYGLELHTDGRISKLQLLPDEVPSCQVRDACLANALVGKAVGHIFQGEHGSQDEWRGMVLARAPIMKAWFYITYEKDPLLYMYRLLDDYHQGDLRIMPESADSLLGESELSGDMDGLTGKRVEYTTEDGCRRVGNVIHQVPARPSVYFIMFDGDFHIYVYDLVRKIL